MNTVNQIPSWVWGFLAALSAVAGEAYYRSNVGRSWGIVLWPGLLLAAVTNFAIWGVMQHESPLGLAVVFSLWTAALRVAWTLYLGDTVALSTWIAFGLVVVASLVKFLLPTAVGK